MAVTATTMTIMATSKVLRAASVAATLVSMIVSETATARPLYEPPRGWVPVTHSMSVSERSLAAYNGADFPLRWKKGDRRTIIFTMLRKDHPLDGSAEISDQIVESYRSALYETVSGLTVRSVQSCSDRAWMAQWIAHSGGPAPTAEDHRNLYFWSGGSEYMIGYAFPYGGKPEGAVLRSMQQFCGQREP
jgi:hypothetical protein